MARPKLVLSAVALIMIVPLSGIIDLIWNGPRSYVAGYRRGPQHFYECLTPGTPVAELSREWGTPSSTFRKEFAEDSWEQAVWFYKFLPVEGLAEVVEFKVWTNGMNWYYFIGVDDHDQVVSKGQGPS